jgi:hypothetical protein
VRSGEFLARSVALGLIIETGHAYGVAAGALAWVACTGAYVAGLLAGGRP